MSPASIAATFARHEPVANACAQSVRLALELCDSGHPDDLRQASDSVALGLATLGLLLVNLQPAVTAAAEKRLLAELFAEA
jgi:hypothetical protein